MHELISKVWSECGLVMFHVVQPCIHACITHQYPTVQIGPLMAPLWTGWACHHTWRQYARSCHSPSHMYSPWHVHRSFAQWHGRVMRKQLAPVEVGAPWIKAHHSNTQRTLGIMHPYDTTTHIGIHPVPQV